MTTLTASDHRSTRPLERKRRLEVLADRAMDLWDRRRERKHLVLAHRLYMAWHEAMGHMA